MPRECLVCGRPLLRNEHHLCIWCLTDLPQTWFWSMPRNRMADRLNALIQRDLTHPDIASSPASTTSSAGSAAQPAQGGFEPYSYAAALFFYDVNANYRRITQALKYQGDLAAGRYFARMLGERLAGSALFADVDVVIPVPLHPLRRWRRGYNQAEVIARVVAECLGVPCETGLLVRRRRTRTQTRLSVEEKAANVRTAFALRLPATHPAPYRHILLIDDVFTTGATLNACRRTLRTAFPHPTRISVATLGYVGSA